MLAFLVPSSCSPADKAGFPGIWEYWANGEGREGRYLVVARQGDGYFVQFLDPERGELQGAGKGRIAGSMLKASIEGCGSVELAIRGRELRAYMRKDRQTEDMSFVYYRSLHGKMTAVREASRLSIREHNEYGGASISSPTPNSPATVHVELGMDAEWRLRHREEAYPANFLKEDPRISSRMEYGPGGRAERIEYRFSPEFAARNHGLRAVLYLLDAKGGLGSRQWLYLGDGGKDRIVTDSGDSGEDPEAIGAAPPAAPHG
jgi:hypothetical protein